MAIPFALFLIGIIFFGSGAPIATIVIGRNRNEDDFMGLLILTLVLWAFFLACLVGALLFLAARLH